VMMRQRIMKGVLLVARQELSLLGSALEALVRALQLAYLDAKIHSVWELRHAIEAFKTLPGDVQAIALESTSVGRAQSAHLFLLQFVLLFVETEYSWGMKPVMMGFNSTT
jgi:hypothetical protein